MNVNERMADALERILEKLCKECKHSDKSHIEDDGSCYVEGCFCPEFQR